MRVRDRSQTTKPGRIVPNAIRAIALGFMLTSAATAYEEPDSSKPGNGKKSPAFSAAEMRLREDITYLAADAREGRTAGDQWDRGGRRLYREDLPGRETQARAGSRRVFPEFLDRRPPFAGKDPGTGALRPRRQDDTSRGPG